MPETLVNVNADFNSTGVLAAGNTAAFVNIKPCTYNNVRVDIQAALATTGSSTPQDLTLTLKWTPITGGTPITINTWVYHALAEIRKLPLSLVHIGDVNGGFNLTAGGVLSLILSAAANDATATVIVTGFYVTGVE